MINILLFAPAPSSNFDAETHASSSSKLIVATLISYFSLNARCMIFFLPLWLIIVIKQLKKTGNERLASLCWGFWQLEYRYGTNKRDLRPFLDDSKAGQSWYSEPKIKAEFQVGDEVVEVHGTFRHVRCYRVSVGSKSFPNFQCSYCAAIPRERDFRMRVYRQDEKKIERGQRDTKTCTRVDFLTYTELQNMAKDSRLENRLLRKELTFSKIKNVALSVKVRSLRGSLSESMNRKDVQKFCNDIREAHSQGKFDGKPALWNFLTDIAQNVIRPGHKRRYNKTTKELFETIRIWGGRRMHNFLSLNFSGPSLSTTMRSTRTSFTYRVGIVEETFIHLANTYAKHMADLGLKAGCVPTLVAEDETVIKRSVYWNAKDDCLIGFCGILENHACEPSFTVKVGSGDTGYKKIVDAFEKNVIAHYARVFIVNPLHARLPKLVLAIQLTCNKFDSKAVRAQWEEIHVLWDKNLREVLGPLIGHSSDGDARRRCCMMEDYTNLKDAGARFAIPWEGWIFSAAKRKDGSIQGLHDQDYIHNGKKLINPLDNAAKRLYLGEELVTLNDIWHVFHTFQGEHGLQLGDVERKDRQNWRAAQRIASRKVQSCLRRLQDPCNSPPMRTFGTETYISVVALYIDIFLSPHMDLRSRVKAASTVSFFLR